MADGNGIDKNLRDHFEYRFDKLEEQMKEHGGEFKEFIKSAFTPFKDKVLSEISQIKQEIYSIKSEMKVESRNTSIKWTAIIGLAFTILNFILAKMT